MVGNFDTPKMSELLLATFPHTPSSLDAATNAAGAAINKMMVEIMRGGNGLPSSNVAELETGIVQGGVNKPSGYISV